MGGWQVGGRGLPLSLFPPARAFSPCSSSKSEPRLDPGETEATQKPTEWLFYSGSKLTIFLSFFLNLFLCALVFFPYVCGEGVQSDLGVTESRELFMLSYELWDLNLEPLEE